MAPEWIEAKNRALGYRLVVDGRALGSVRNTGKLDADGKLWRVNHYGHGHTMAYNFREAKTMLLQAVGMVEQ